MIPVIIIIICIILVSSINFDSKEDKRIKKINDLLPIEKNENLIIKIKNLLNDKQG
ncbi:MAG: hypothetical protein IJ134_01870 [Bacilli bacterium]|nr:hypothetical protein [Bacilli bacterium]